VPDKTVYHVFHQNDRWHVTADERSRTWGDYATQEDAVREARLLADATTPSEVMVHHLDGSVVKDYRHRLKPARHR
jgi:hypothetical protein